MQLKNLYQLYYLSSLSLVLCHGFVPISRKASLMIFPIRGGESTPKTPRTTGEDNRSTHNKKTFTQQNVARDDNANINDKAIDVDIVTDKAGDSAAKSARLMSSFAMSPQERFQLGKSYSLTALLWSSITLDVLNNKRKRCWMVPGVEVVHGQIVTWGTFLKVMNLALGYVLAAGISYFLSNEFKKKDKGLSSSSSASSYDIENTNEFMTKDESIRKKMHLFLFLFGVLNLGAHLNYSKAPFLGMSGFVINTINSLTALDGWKKDTIVEGQTVKGELIQIGKSFMDSFKSLSDGRMFMEVEKSWQKLVLSIVTMISGLAVVQGLRILLTVLMPYYLSLGGAVSQSNLPLLFFDSMLQIILMELLTSDDVVYRRKQMWII